MWTLFRVNVLSAMISGRFSKDIDAFAEFYTNEYDSCIKRGGDMIYGVPVLNANTKGMADVIKAALKKGQESDGENFNILQEIYPAAFDAYWLGVEMAPFPNPLLKPGGWQTTLPAPGAVMNIGPNPISLAASAAIHKALVEAIQALVDELKNKTVSIPNVGEFNIYDTVTKLLKNEPIPNELKTHPLIIAAKSIFFELKEAKKKKPSIGSQMKKAIKFPFPELPKRKKLLEEARKKAQEEAVTAIKESLIKPIEELILAPYLSAISAAVELSKQIPKKPTKDELKQLLKDTIDGIVPSIDLPGIDIPKLPTKEEFKKMIEEQLPTKEELLAMAYDLIKDKIPDIPNIFYIPPTLVFSYPTNILIEPFITVAKIHLMGTSGTMMVMAQYPPPAPPAPAILNWSGYSVIG